MMEMNFFIFRQSEKKQISGNLGTEYAPDREDAAEIPMGDNPFCSFSEVQNVGNLNFLKFFEKPIVGAIILQNEQIPAETRSCGPF